MVDYGHTHTSLALQLIVALPSNHIAYIAAVSQHTHSCNTCSHANIKGVLTQRTNHMQTITIGFTLAYEFHLLVLLLPLSMECLE